MFYLNVFIDKIIFSFLESNGRAVSSELNLLWCQNISKLPQKLTKKKKKMDISSSLMRTNFID